MVKASKNEEDKMRLMTSSELSGKSKNELRGLFSKVSLFVVMTERDTPERRNSLATLENISRAMCISFFAP